MTDLKICPTCDIEFYSDRNKYCSKSCVLLMGRHVRQQKRQNLIQDQPLSKILHGHTIEVPVYREVDEGGKIRRTM